MAPEDTRWIQRYHHFLKAFARLKAAVELAQKRELSELEEQGLIQAFEFTHELAWKTLKDFLESRGVQNLYGSKDTTREAFRQELISDGETWMDMIRSRNLSSHTYNEETAKAIAEAVQSSYFGAFSRLLAVLADLEARES